MNAATLRAKLLNLLAADLGKFSNNQPAIWVFPPEPPSRSDGLQCLVQRVPENKVSMLSSGQRFGDRDWIVTLINFKPDQSLDNALYKIITYFVTKKYSYIPATESTFEQVRIMICDPIVINGA